MEDKMMKNFCDECGVEITVANAYGDRTAGNNWSGLQISCRHGYYRHEFCSNCAKRVMDILPNIRAEWHKRDAEEHRKELEGNKDGR